ncbi:hypothetical protein FSP39_022753 [Pinctada imbricata]|uniref:Uncharacterized protein n=1 Tax=Pinctada imbricata TaxID=66713 RepID=A0AA88Y211_PINIB|nr:hypothetical protein FSP39_022753 [Pinctada imbricata]
MVATPLPDSGDLQNPSLLFGGKTYEAMETPVSHKLSVGAGNSYQWKDAATYGDNTRGKSVQFDVTKQESEIRSNTVMTTRTVPILHRSKSVPADTKPAMCTDVLLQKPPQTNNVKKKKEFIDNRNVKKSDSSHIPLLSLECKEENEYDQIDRKARVCTNKSVVTQDSCTVTVPEDSDDIDDLKKSRKARKDKCQCICTFVIVPVVLSILVLLSAVMGWVIYFGNQSGGETTAAPMTTLSTTARTCGVYETTVDNDAVATDEIRKDIEYTVPFKIINASRHDIFSKDGRHFTVREPGFYDVHVTLHLDAYSWIEPKDFERRFVARLCAVVGASRPQCVTNTLVAKDRDSVHVDRKLHFKSVKDKLKFTLTLDDAKMLKRSKKDNVIQNSNHSDELSHTDAESNVEFALPWIEQENPSTDSIINIKQIDNKNIQVQRSDWYVIACSIVIDSLSVKQTNSVYPSAATVCITIDHPSHQPVCKKVSMATRSVIPVQVSSRIFLRSDDIISIVVHTSSNNSIQKGRLQIHRDPC